MSGHLEGTEISFALENLAAGLARAKRQISAQKIVGPETSRVENGLLMQAASMVHRHCGFHIHLRKLLASTPK